VIDQSVINTVITIGAGVIGWVLKTLWDATRRLEADLSDIEVLVAGEYVRRDEFRQDMDRIFAKLDSIEGKGWSCGVAMAWHFVGQPIAVFVIAYAGVETPPLPVFEMESLLTVLLGMLGLGGLRTFEKTKQVAREK
jgi:hypothetical protein